MKRERIEDLGVIYQMLVKYIDDNDFVNECQSKHSIEGFINRYKGEEKMVDLHNNLRSLHYFLYELLGVARGEEE